jgi:hypothetical protein
MCLNNEFKTVFDNIHAEEEIKQSTKAFIAEKTNNYCKKRVFHPAHLITAFACLIFILIGIRGYSAYYTPVSEISIDINPSLEVGINRFDRVISVVGYNDDGKALADTLNIKNMSYESAVETIMANDSIQEYMAKGELLSITVVGNNNDKSQEMLDYVSSCTKGRNNISCHFGNRKEMEAAHKVGLSAGKYRMLLQLQALDPSITAEDVRGMTMRQIQSWIDKLSGSSTDSEQNGSCGTDDGNGTDKGNGKCQMGQPSDS